MVGLTGSDFGGKDEKGAGKLWAFAWDPVRSNSEVRI